MGRRHHAHIHGLRGDPPDRLDLPFLEHAEQLHLHVGRHIADLIEKQRAAVGKLKAPEPIRQGPGKGALAMAEEFAFEKIGGDSAAVHRYEGRIGATALGMHEAGDHFLARAAFPADEERGRGLGHLSDERAQPLHSGGGADQG